jgi:hypothetical protein
MLNISKISIKRLGWVPRLVSLSAISSEVFMDYKFK